MESTASLISRMEEHFDLSKMSEYECRTHRKLDP